VPLALLTSVTLGGLQGDPDGIGIFKCLDGDDCQRELYDYGPITSDYPHFPVMTEERWCLHNDYKTSSVVCPYAFECFSLSSYRLNAEQLVCVAKTS
jgi:hypothetical protein